MTATERRALWNPADGEGAARLFSALRSGRAFRFESGGPVYVKCRGGFRPGCGGQLHACAPHVSVIPVNAV